MAHVVKDRVKDTTTTTGTGTVTLANSAPSGFRTFGSVLANSDTTFYCIALGSEWEAGIGTYTSSGTTLARTTVIASSNANTLVSFSAGIKDVFQTVLADYLCELDNLKSLNLPIVASNPPAPATDTLNIYARKLSGRVMFKWMGPSGVDIFAQPSLFGNRIITFNPNTGTVGTGQGLGVAWTSNGTVFHPTPATTAPAISNQMKRTRYANVVTTTNQQLGPRFNVASEQQFYRGNAAGLGGFFFSTRFIVELYPAATIRIFAGLQGASATGSVCISDTVVNNVCGLWHDTTDSSTTFNFVTRDATTTTKQTIALSNAIAAGNSYDFTMFCAPNGTTIFWRLDDTVNNVTYENSTSTTLPVNTVFMSPQVQMSNGTANTTVTTSAIGVAGIYVESDR